MMGDSRFSDTEDQEPEYDNQDEEILLGQHEDEEDDEGVNVLDDTGFWDAEAVAILQPFKEEWCNGERSDELVTRALKALREGGIEERTDMKKAVKLWLQRRALLRSKYGPGHIPSL